MEFGRHEASPEELSCAPASGRIEVQGEECVEEVVSEKGHEQKALNGVRVVLEDVIGVPFVDQLVEAVILDVPALVAETDHAVDGNLGRR
jgi:hypothetical protein